MNATQSQDWMQAVSENAERARINASYEQQEHREHARLITEIESAPLAERKQNTTEWLSDAFLRPEIIARTVEYIIAGNYGWGAMQAARHILHSPRMNQVAALTILAAQLEWRAPAAMVRKAWKSMPPAYQVLLHKAVSAEIA